MLDKFDDRRSGKAVGRQATRQEQTQASIAALITLLLAAVWVLAVVARPCQW